MHWFEKLEKPHFGHGKKTQKNQKNHECQFWIKLEKPHFGPILVTFDSKTSKLDFFQKIIWVNLKKKTTKNKQTKLKTLCWAHFEKLLAQKPRNKVFPKKFLSGLILSFSYCNFKKSYLTNLAQKPHKIFSKELI